MIRARVSVQVLACGAEHPVRRVCDERQPGSDVVLDLTACAERPREPAAGVDRAAESPSGELLRLERPREADEQRDERCSQLRHAGVPFWNSRQGSRSGSVRRRKLCGDARPVKAPRAGGGLG